MFNEDALGLWIWLYLGDLVFLQDMEHNERGREGVHEFRL